MFALVKHTNLSKMPVFNLCRKTESGEKSQTLMSSFRDITSYAKDVHFL